MPMDRSKYPPEWEAISRAVRDRADDACEICGVKNYSVGFWRDEVFQAVSEEPSYTAAKAFQLSLQIARPNAKIVVIVLTCAHLNHDTTDNRPENLAILCQRHHNRHDVEFRKANRKASSLARRAAGSLFPAETITT